jgi:predicted RNA-binding Zn-ribbon protein involved in translation (DUF1610 family)
MNLYDIAKEEHRRRLAGEPPLPLLQRPPSFAERTGQARRYWVGQAISILGGIVLVAGWFMFESAWGPTLTLAGMSICLVGFIATCLAVRCPRCRVAVVWHTYKTRSAATADQLAAWQVTCPKCGYEPPVASEPRLQEKGGVVEQGVEADEAR